jgi:hypothetical protein
MDYFLEQNRLSDCLALTVSPQDVAHLKSRIRELGPRILSDGDALPRWCHLHLPKEVLTRAFDAYVRKALDHPHHDFSFAEEFVRVAQLMIELGVARRSLLRELSSQFETRADWNGPDGRWLIFGELCIARGAELERACKVWRETIQIEARSKSPDDALVAHAETRLRRFSLASTREARTVPS